MWFRINTGRQVPGEPWVDHNVYTTRLTAGADDPFAELKTVLGDIVEMEGGTLPHEIYIEVGEGEPPSIEDWLDDALERDHPTPPAEDEMCWVCQFDPILNDERPARATVRATLVLYGQGPRGEVNGPVVPMCDDHHLEHGNGTVIEWIKKK